jgi:hypothetical protein
MGIQVIHDFCKDLTLCSSGYALQVGGGWYHVYCFAKLADAEKFREHFGGEKFDPSERGRGRNWARWNKR